MFRHHRVNFIAWKDDFESVYCIWEFAWYTAQINMETYVFVMDVRLQTQRGFKETKLYHFDKIRMDEMDKFQHLDKN